MNGFRLNFIIVHWLLNVSQISNNIHTIFVFNVDHYRPSFQICLYISLSLDRSRWVLTKWGLVLVIPLHVCSWVHSWHISGQCLQTPSEAKCFSEQAGLHSHCSRSKGLLQDRHLVALPVHVLQDPLHSLQVSESLKYPLLNKSKQKANFQSTFSYQRVQDIWIISIYGTCSHSTRPNRFFMLLVPHLALLCLQEQSVHS